MRKLITLALLISASVTAQAKLGETREQIIQRFSQQAMTDSGANYMEFVGKNYVFVFFGAAGRSTTEIYQMKTAYSAADANEIAKTVLGGMRWRWQQVKTHLLRSTDGMYEIADVTVEPGYRWGIAVGYALGGVPSQPTPAPQPAPQVVAPDADPSRTPNDCGIVAAQAYAKLKPATYWCQIVAIKGLWQDDGKNRGHAVVVYKYQADGYVYAYDERGSLRLSTTSENLDDLKPALQIATPECSIQAVAFVTH